MLEEVLAAIQAFVDPAGYGRVTIPMLAGFMFAEGAKRLAKGRGINKWWIPWGTSILVGTWFAAELYNPAWPLSIFSASLLIGVATPTIHSILLTALGQFESTKGIARKLAGQTKSIDTENISIETSIDPTTGKQIIKVVDESDDKTVFQQVMTRLAPKNNTKDS